MIIVDTSVWADFFRGNMPELSDVLAGMKALQHPFVTGELLLGNPADRQALKRDLEGLAQARVSDHDTAMQFAFDRNLGGTGIGYVDLHLLASAASADAMLWTRDKRLLAQAGRLGLAYKP